MATSSLWSTDGGTRISNLLGDSFSASSVVVRGPDSTPPIVNTPTVPGGIFARGTGKTITSVIFDSSAVAEYTSIIMYVDTGKATTGLSGHGYRQYPGTTTDTQKTRTYSFTIPDSFVSVGDSFVYYITAIDTRGNSGTYASSGAPATVQIVGGMTFRGWAGGANATFEKDSRPFQNSQWLADSVGRVTRSTLTLTDTTVPARIKLQDLSTYADSAEIYLNGARVGVCTTFVGGSGFSQADVTLNLNYGQNNSVMVVMFDTGALPNALDTLTLYVENIRPRFDSAAYLLALGANQIDTVKVLVRLDTTGGGSFDTNPNRIFRYMFSPETQFAPTGNDTRSLSFDDTTFYYNLKKTYGLYADSFYLTLDSNYINSANGLATVYAYLEDDAGNVVQLPSSDTIIVDLFPPVLTVGSHSPRATSNAIAISGTVVDTASGVASATIVARNSGGASDSIIAMSLSAGTALSGTWRGMIDTSVVGSDTTKTVLYYITCTDVVGRASRYPAAGWDTITLVAGMSGRYFFGKAASFAADSEELVTPGVWNSVASSLNNFPYFRIDTVTLAHQLTVTEATGFGDTFTLFVDTSGTGAAYAFIGESNLIAGSATLILNGLVPKDTTYVKVIIGDTAGLMPQTTMIGKIHVDYTAPSVTTSNSIISNGSQRTDTRFVYFNFGIGGGVLVETGPLGIRYVSISDTSATAGVTYAYSDSFYFTIPDTMISSQNGTATPYFRFTDYTGNVSQPVSDTITIDLFSPLVNMSNPGARAKNRAISISTPMVDTGSGVASATLFARHQTTTGTTYIVYPMTFASGTAQSGNWTAMISDTVVGAVADTTVGVEYFIMCTDVVGRSGAYRSSGSPDTIQIVNGISARTFAGPQGGSFATDSVELLSTNSWIEQGVARSSLTTRDTSNPIRIRVREFTGLATHFRAYLDTTSRTGATETAYVLIGESTLVSSGTESTADLNISFTIVNETNFIRIVVYDSTGLIPSDTRQANFYRDSTPPYFTSPLATISSAFSDTNRVNLIFGVGGTVAADTAPNGITKVFISDSAGYYGAEYTYADSMYFYIPDTMISVVNGQAVAYFTFKDGAGNYSATAVDTVRIDRQAPTMVVGSHSPRPINYAISVTGTLSDTGSGVTSATLYARNSAGATDSVVAMAITVGDSASATWRGMIDTSVVGIDTTRTVLYYIQCTDVVGRASRYPTSGWDTVTLVNGMSGRYFFGKTATFAADSAELSATGYWSSANFSNYQYFLMDTVGLAHRLTVTEGTLLGDTFTLFVDTSGTGASYVYMTESNLIAGSATIILSGNLPKDTTLVRITVGDTAGIMPAVQSVGRLFVDFTAPSVTSSNLAINSGGQITDTRLVNFKFDATAANVIETGPLGIRYVSISDTSATAGVVYVYSDSRYFTIPDTMLNAQTGVATAYFRFTDYTGNVSSSVSDTILLDLYTPVISTGNGGVLGSYLRRAKGQSIAITARLSDSGGVSSATLFARHNNDTPTYTPIAMSTTGDVKDAVWNATIPVSIVGYIADSTNGVSFTITCTDAYNRSRSYGPDTIEIVNGVDGKVYVKLNPAKEDYTEITQSGASLSRYDTYVLKISSSLGDTIEIYRVRGGVGTTLVGPAFFSLNFDSKIVAVDSQFQTGDSLVVVIRDSDISLNFEDTYLVTIDTTKPVISAFTLDPSRTISDTSGVYLSVTMNQAEQNLRLFITQSADTSTASDSTRQYNTQAGHVVDSRVSLPFFNADAALRIGDSIVIYASAWDAAGNIADTVKLSFLYDRAAPIVTTDTVSGSRPLNETVTVTATIYDTTRVTSGLQSVNLGVSVNGGAVETYTMSAIDTGASGIYRGQIPASKIGSTAGTVLINVSAVDFFGRLGNDTRTFTLVSQSLDIADSSLSYTSGSILYTQASLAYVRITAPGDTIRVQIPASGVDSTVTPGSATQDTFAVTLAKDTNTVTITRTNARGDSQIYTRYFILDTTAPTISLVALDVSNTAQLRGDTQCPLRIVATDSPFGLGAYGVAAYKYSGDVTGTGVDSFVIYSTTDTVDITITLTSTQAVKTCTVTVRDRAGNTATATDTITLGSAALGSPITIDSTTTSVSGGTVTRDTTNSLSTLLITETSSTPTTVKITDSWTYVIVDPAPSTGDTVADTARIQVTLNETGRTAQVYVREPLTMRERGLSMFTLGASDTAFQYVGDRAVLESTVRVFELSDSLGNIISPNDSYFRSLYVIFDLPLSIRGNANATAFYFRTSDSQWVNIKSDPTMWDTSASDSFVLTDTQLRIKIKHFTMIGVTSVGNFTATTLNNVVVFPNPFVPYDGIDENGTMQSGIYISFVPAGASIDIYDIRGQFVDRVQNTGTTGLVRWDARNADNQEVASGVYLIVVRSGGQTVVKKVAVVR